MSTNRLPDARPTQSRAADRHMCIELLRMRAGYERLAVRRSACQLASELHPEALALQARDRLGSMGLGWLGTGLQTLRRYPMLLSLLTSVFARGRRGSALKTALVAGLLWQVRRKRRNSEG